MSVAEQCDIPYDVIRQQIASCFDLVVHLTRAKSRRPVADLLHVQSPLHHSLSQERTNDETCWRHSIRYGAEVLGRVKASFAVAHRFAALTRPPRFAPRHLWNASKTYRLQVAPLHTPQRPDHILNVLRGHNWESCARRSMEGSAASWNRPHAEIDTVCETADRTERDL